MSLRLIVDFELMIITVKACLIGRFSVMILSIHNLLSALKSLLIVHDFRRDVSNCMVHLWLGNKVVLSFEPLLFTWKFYSQRRMVRHCDIGIRNLLKMWGLRATLVVLKQPVPSLNIICREDPFLTIFIIDFGEQLKDTLQTLRVQVRLIGQNLHDWYFIAGSNSTEPLQGP